MSLRYGETSSYKKGGGDGDNDGGTALMAGQLTIIIAGLRCRDVMPMCRSGVADKSTEFTWLGRRLTADNVDTLSSTRVLNLAGF